jgi:four helix bundle protein
MSHSYRDLIAWQKAKRLAVITYGVTERFPQSETFGLTSQLRRCAVSIASNVAEGQGRNTKGEFIQSLGHARGSLLELQTQSEIAFDLKYVSEADYRALDKLSGDVLGLLNRLMESIEKRRAADGASPSSNVKRETSKRVE